MSREIVHTDNAPKAIGPYAQAIKANGFVYTAGQIAIRPESGDIVDGGIAAQTRQVFVNLATARRLWRRAVVVCGAAGPSGRTSRGP